MYHAAGSFSPWAGNGQSTSLGRWLIPQTPQAKRKFRQHQLPEQQWPRALVISMKSSALKAELCINPHAVPEMCVAWEMEGVDLLQLSEAQLFFFWSGCHVEEKSINHSQHFSNYPLFRFNLSKLEPWCKSKSEIAVSLFWASWHLVIFNTIKYKWNFLLLQRCFHCRQGQVCTQMTTGNTSVTSSNHLLLRLTRAMSVWWAELCLTHRLQIHQDLADVHQTAQKCPGKVS